MNPRILFVCLILLNASCAGQEKPSQKQSSIYVGTSICAGWLKPLLNIPTEDSCNKMKWTISLSSDPAVTGPAKFGIEREYGFYVDNSTYKVLGKDTIKGQWKMISGVANDPSAAVFALTPDGKQQALMFIKLDDNLIHLLDPNKKLMVGDGSQSFTFTRIK